MMPHPGVEVGTFLFKPTSAPRVNAIEGFFPKLSRQRLGNAAFNPVDECAVAVGGYIEQSSIKMNTTPARPAGAGSSGTSWRHGKWGTGSRGKRASSV